MENQCIVRIIQNELANFKNERTGVVCILVILALHLLVCDRIMNE